MKLDFFARRAHYVDHLAPNWSALPDLASFSASGKTEESKELVMHKNFVLWQVKYA